MSHQDNIEASQSLVDTLQACETKSLSSMCSESPDFESVLKSSTPLPDSPNVPESAEDALSTSGTLDPNNHVVIIEQPHSRIEANSLVLSQDNLASACGLSDSEASSIVTADSYSSGWSYVSETPSCGILGRCYKVYKYYIRVFRYIGGLFPFEIICLAFSIGCCFMGAYNWPLCPADANIPRYVFFNGALATFSVCMQIVFSLWKIFIHGYGRQGSDEIYCCAFGFGWVAITTTLVEMVEFYTMSYSFHRVDANYCNEAFYWFVHYKNIAFGVVMALTAAFYIPGRNFFRDANSMLPVIL